ncbi:hypothetical protein CSKR_114112 [Clonorchis sinensis]|uniref:Uncharacterized protein n=2 Tax=Clonorchis sinensis TaxID=79923 RepID=A0A3R7CT28_CLOSI|nr:hypothetical protein CSKR_114112 [Clonorchis sinensis]
MVLQMNPQKLRNSLNGINVSLITKKESVNGPHRKMLPYLPSFSCVIILLMNSCSTSVNPNLLVDILPSPVILITPERLLDGQSSWVYAFSADEMNMSFSTGCGEESTKWVMSEPIGGVHRVAYKLNQPSEGMRAVDLEVHVTFTGEKGKKPVSLYRHLPIDTSRDLILIETDKPTYRPGETVWFSVIHLQPKHWSLMPERESRPDPIFSITVSSDDENVIKKWNDVQASSARKLSVQVPVNATYGTWTINVQMAGGTKSATILTLGQRYLVPTIRFEPIMWDFVKNQWYKLGVCVNQTDGRAAEGPTTLLLCQCESVTPDSKQLDWYHSSFVLDSKATKTLMDKKVCYRGDAVRRPCSFADGLILDGRGCVRHSFLPSLFRSEHDILSTGALFVACVRVFDAPTGRFHQSCQVLSDRPRTEGEITFPPYYKYGIPVSGSVRQHPSAHLSKYRGRLRTYYIDEKCKQMPWTDIRLPKRVSNRDILGGLAPRVLHSDHIIEQNEFLIASFILPPIFSASPIFVQSLPNRFIHGQLDSTPQNTIYPLFGNNTYEAIQLWPSSSEPIEMTCESTARFTVVGNTHLADKQWFVFAYARGTIVKLELFSDEEQLKYDSQCHDQDGPLGHYVCLSKEGDQNDAIECLPGWHGIGCLEPVCSKPCHPQTGYCLLPNECRCRYGWTGKACNECLHCMNNTCGALDGLIPWPCEMPNTQKIVQVFLEVMRSPRSTQQSKRFLFQRTLTVNIQTKVYDELKFVVFYFRRDVDGAMEPVATHGVIRRTGYCPQEAAVKFDRHHAIPGATVQLTVKPDTTVLSENAVCHVRVWDERILVEATHRNLLNAGTYEKKLSHILKRTRLREATSSGSFYEFESAGLKLTGLVAEVNETRSECRPWNDDPLPPDFPSEQRVWYSESILYEVGKIQRIYSESEGLERTSYQGLQYYFNVPETGQHVRASAFCYGDEKGVWSSTSEPMSIDSDTEFHLIGVSEMDLLETASLKVALSLHSFIIKYDCVGVVVKIRVDDRMLSVSGPQIFSWCVCDPTVETFVTQVSAKFPGTTLIQAELFLYTQSPLCGTLHTPSNYSELRQPKPLRNAIKLLRIRSDQNPEVRLNVLNCFNLPPSNESARTFQLQIDDQPVFGYTASGRTYLSFSSDVADSIMRNLDYIYQTPMVSAYECLCVLSTVGQVLAYLVPYYTEPPPKNIHNMVVSSSQTLLEARNRLSRFRLYRGPGKTLSITEGLDTLDAPVPWLFYRAQSNYSLYTEDGVTVDWKLNLLIYRTLAHIERIKLQWISEAKNYMRSDITELFYEFQSAYPVPNCHKSDVLSNNETKLSFFSQWYIAAEESRLEKTVFMKENKEMWRTIRRLEVCLALYAHRDLERTKPQISQLKTSTLTSLAYALSLIDPDLKSLKKVIQMIRERQIRTQSKFGQELHWEDSVEETTKYLPGERANPTEVTYHAYMALYKSGEKFSELIPIIRWQMKHLSVFGTVHNPLESYIITLQVFTFAQHLNRQSKSTSKKPRASFQTEWGSEVTQNSNSQAFDQPNDINFGSVQMVDESDDRIRLVNLTVIPHENAAQCVLASLTHVYWSPSESPVEERTRNVTLRVRSGRNPLNDQLSAQVTICLHNQTAQAVQLIVKHQTGWEMGQINKLSSESPPLSGLVNATEGNRAQFILFRKQSNPTEDPECLKLDYTLTANMFISHPMSISVEPVTSEARWKMQVSTMLPTCDELFDPDCAKNQSLTQPKHMKCPWRINEHAQLVKSLSTQCSQTIYVLEHSANQTMLQVYSVAKSGVFSMRKVRPSKQLVSCLSNLQPWTILIPQHTEGEQSPEDNQAVDSKDLFRSTPRFVFTFEADEYRQSVFRLGVARVCKSFQTIHELLVSGIITF